MLKPVTKTMLQIGLAGLVLFLSGCAYEGYHDDGGYYRPERHYYERVDYRYGHDHYDHHDWRRYDRYDRCD